MKTYVIKTVNGGDTVSQEYTTHKEATWHMWNDKEYAVNDIIRSDAFYVDTLDDWVDAVVQCPKCGKDAGYTDAERDVIECYNCNSFTPIY